MSQISPTEYTLKRSWARTFAVLLGIAASIILLETGLRISGFVRERLTFEHNSRPLPFKTGKTIHVLCLGESTTSRQYPEMLETELNSRSSHLHFKVFDAGRPGINSDDIVLSAQELIDKVNPDIITVMMGCNDGEQILDYGDVRSEKEFRLMRRFRVFGLARMLWWNIKTLNGTQDSLPNPAKNSGLSFRDYISSLRDFDTLAAPDAVYLLAEEFLPANSPEEQQSKLDEAVIYFKTAPAPMYIRAQNKLAFLYYYSGEYKQALELLDGIVNKTKKLNCTNWLIRAACFRARSKEDRAKLAVMHALQERPRSWWDFEELADALMVEGNYPKALEILTRAVKKFPDKYFYHTQIATIHLLNNDYPNASAQAELAAAKAPAGNKRVMKKLLLAHTLSNGAQSYKYLDTNDFPMPKTLSNYERLIGMAADRGIYIVPVQYPMRSILPLKSALKTHPNLIFVENRKEFMRECADKGFNALFKDAFGGDYGHCTEYGNRIIAKNIARELLKHITLTQEQGKQAR